MNTLSEMITDHRFFEGMKPEHLNILTEGATSAHFETGQQLFRQGEPAGRLYLVTRGRLAVEARAQDGQAVPVETLGTGDIVGWSWLFPPFVWHFQAHALEPSEVIVLQGARLLVAAERDHDFGFELMKRVAQVAIRRLQATRMQLVRS